VVAADSAKWKNNKPFEPQHETTGDDPGWWPGAPRTTSPSSSLYEDVRSRDGRRSGTGGVHGAGTNESVSHPELEHMTLAAKPQYLVFGGGSGPRSDQRSANPVPGQGA